MILEDFVVFEGLDGSGTSTQIKNLASKIKKPVFITNEPSDNAVGKLVRDVLQKKYAVESVTLALLYSSDRYEHLFGKGGIKEKLDNKYTVLCDRYMYSSFAYQSVDVDISYLRKINDYPDAETIIYIDTDINVCLERIKKRGEKEELFEKREYLSKVRKNYERIFSSLPSSVRFIKIDGNKDILAVEKEIEKAYFKS